MSFALFGIKTARSCHLSLLRMNQTEELANRGGGEHNMLRVRVSGGGGGEHNMLRVRVCAAHMGGFLGQNSLNKGPFFGRFFINMGGLPRN